MDGLLTKEGNFYSKKQESHFDLIRKVYNDSKNNIDDILKKIME